MILAASAVESARIALLSESASHPRGLGNRSGRVGRTLCFHASTFASAVMPGRMHPHRGRSASHVMMEPCLPVTDSRLARWAGLPYLRGGVVEIGGSPQLIDEALAYDQVPFLARGRHKEWMRGSSLRDRLIGCQMLAEDLPQLANRVDLDPAVRDVYGLPVARVTYKNHAYEQTARQFYIPYLKQVVTNAGATSVFVTPCLSFVSGPPSTRHVMGTLRMGADPATSVVDPGGRFHDLDNLFACDGSVLPTSSGYNPTLTIIAVALRIAHGLAGTPPTTG